MIPSQEEVKTLALHAAAALIECEDFESLLGTDFVRKWGNSAVMDERMDEAQRYVVQELRNLAR